MLWPGFFGSGRQYLSKRWTKCQPIGGRSEQRNCYGQTACITVPGVPVPAEKKQVKTLYIDADEDHVSLQYLDKKGDIKDSRSNTFMPKLVYVYEGIEAEEERHKLIGVKYFGGGYEGSQKTEELWKEVFNYISEAYDDKELERIYINGDGAEWIKSGAKLHGNAKFVLDRFHMHKYILTATSHLLDSAQDARSEIFRAINGKRKRMRRKSLTGL